MTVPRPRIPSDAGVRKPAALSFADLDEIISVADLRRATGLDKATILKAIHAGALPAWYPGGNTMLGFRMHRADAEAWFFNDPSRAHTKAQP